VGARWRFHKQARVLDLNQDGALARVSRPVLPDTVHAVTFEHAARGLVSKYGFATSGSGGRPTAQGVISPGVEFISVPPPFPNLVAALA
jgi:hypothetical protein